MAKTEPPLIGPNTVLELTIDAVSAEDAYNRSLRKKAQNFKADGFRRGKAPLSIAESALGQEAIIQDALQLVVPKAYEELIKKSGKSPLTYPEFNPISLKKGEVWKLEVHIAEAPQIKLGDYKKIIKNAKKEAEKHEKEMEKQRKDAEKSKEVAEKSKNDQKSEQDDGKHNDHHDDHDHSDHDHDSHAQSDQHRQDHTLQHIYADLVKTIQPQIPELLVKEEVRGELDTLVRRLQSLKLDLDSFLKQRGMTFEQLSQEFAFQALGRLQLTFILEAIVTEQKLSVEQAEIDATIAKTEDKALQKRQQTDPSYQRWLKQTLIRQKVVSHLLEI